jgi:CHAT domain-containing protein
MHLVWALLFACTLVASLRAQSAGSDPQVALKEAERFFALDNWNKARPLYRQCEDLYSSRGDRRNALFCKFGRLRADAETTLSYPEVARILAVDLLDPIMQRDPELRLRALVVKAAAELSINDPVRSGEEWEEALGIAQRLGDRRQVGRIQAELSIVAFLKGDPKTALVRINEAYKIARELKDIAGQIRVLSLRGVAALEQNAAAPAIPAFDQALELARANPDVRFPLMAYMGKSQALHKLGDEAGSMKLLDEARKFVELRNMSVYRADLLNALGARLQATDKTRAEQLFREAAESALKAGMPRPYSEAMFRLTDLLIEAGDFRGARSTVEMGLKASRELVDMEFLPRHLAVAGNVEARLGNPTAANAYFEEAGDLVESVLFNAPSVSIKSAVLDTMSYVYRTHFRFALKNEGSPAKAFLIVEKAKGRVIADRLRARPLWSLDAAAPPSEAEKEVSAIQRSLVLSNSREERRNLLDRLHAAERQLSSVEPQSFRGWPQSEKSVELTDIQRLLRSDEVLLEFVVDDPESTCMAITRSSITPYSLPAAKTLEPLISDYFKEMKASVPRQKRVAARKLFDALVAPVVRGRRQSRLIVVGDGSMNLISFDSLVTEQGKFLVETHTTTYAPSATVLSLMRSGSTRKAPPLSVLAVGDTVVGKVEPKPSTKGKTRGVFDLVGGSFPALPSAREEVNNIARYAGSRGRTLVGVDATETAFKQQPLDKFRVLHFATHAFADTNFPDRSAIILSSEGSGANDGLLQIREIRNLVLNADLVTVSACDAGFGRIQGIDGLASIVNAFLFAGAHAVVASSWSADDTFTASLIRRFYSHLAQGKDSGSALRYAKLDMLAQAGDKALPLYWAGFFLTGDSHRQISLRMK